MYLIVGLGNPGKKYEGTRHNVGYMMLDAVEGLAFSDKVRLKGQLAKEGDLVYLKPTTFMNNSGEAVRATVDYYGISIDHVIVIHDELDLPFGEVRHSFDRGAAGHRGILSITESLGTQAYQRIRVGIGRSSEPIPTESYVLQQFSTEQKEELESIVAHTRECLESLLND